ncbi:sporulation protein YunB [Ectobacillus ponti]|uniref:Sporulation protein YunB n=1 Tax=Ectobacillus ponti TaxID=2961894 RepID=A0AA41X6K9_9BACI|nr:sporulation protein YunB [Ectobacillus ponti]MCP8969752.1 sporulation protein YunB [Ectobacillus ponti]
MRRYRPSTFRLRRGPLPFPYVLLISFIIFLFMTIQGLWIVNRSIEPTLVTYAEMQTKRLATVVITKAVEERVKEGLNSDKIVKLEKDKDGNVIAADLNSQIVNDILTETTASVEKYLHEAEKGNSVSLGIENDPKLHLEQNNKDGITLSVPLGQITKNALLANLGPDIPVKFTVIGDVQPNIRQQIEPSGINNTILKIVMEVEVAVQVIIPFETKQTVVKTDVPIKTLLIQGKVPEYFNGGTGSGMSPALPAKKKE